MRILLLIWLLAATAWAGPTAALVGIVHSTVPSGRSLHGYEYVDGAEVSLEGTDLKTKTNEVGLFEFRKIDPGTYTVVVRCAGFKDVREEVEVIALPMPVTVVLAMEPAKP